MVTKLFPKHKAGEHEARMWLYKHTGAHQSINYPMAEGLFPVNGVGKGVGSDAPEDAFLQVDSDYSVAKTTNGYWRATAPKGEAQMARMFHTEEEAQNWLADRKADARGVSMLQSSEQFVDATDVEEFPDPDNKEDIQDEINLTPTLLVTKEGYWRASYPLYDNPKEGMVTKLFPKHKEGEHAARMWLYKHTGAHQSINYPMAEGLFPVNGGMKGVGGDAPEDAFIQVAETVEGSGDGVADQARQADIDVRA
jgi:hypothetical protein